MEQEELRPSEVAREEESAPCEEKVLEETANDSEPTALDEITQTTEAEPKADLPSDITHRLAGEFFALREEFPSLERPEQLPDAVLDMAVEQSIPLLDAYLRFCHEENKRRLREEQCRRQAAACSTGSLQQGGAQPNPEQDAFLRAFRKALK